MVENRRVYAATWCPICENQVSEKYKDTEELLHHIRTCHPPVPDDQRVNAKQKVRFQGLKKTAKRLNPFKKSSESAKKVREEPVSESRKDVRGEKILCPACDVESAPLLFEKQSRKFIANCRLGAICLLGCWPLCFVPLMISRDKSVRMVCPLCGYDYGTYDVRNAKDSTVIVDTPETLPGTTEILSKTSSTRICHRNENILPVNTCDESTIVEKSMIEKFDDNHTAEVKKLQQEEFNHRREYRCDKAVECKKNEKNVKEAETFPTELFDYAVERVDRKIQPVEMETCEFCLAEVDSDSESSSQWFQKLPACHQPISKCYDDWEYSTFRRQCSTDRHPVSMDCQHARCRHKNLNDCCGNKNMKGTRDEIIFRHRENVRDEQSCVQRDEWTNEYSPLFANAENCYDEEYYRQDWG